MTESPPTRPLITFIDSDMVASGQHLLEDDERFLPEHMGIERPGVREPVPFGELGQLNHAGRRWVGLENDSEIHDSASRLAQVCCGNPRSTPRWMGSGQRLITTLGRV